jgi:hypothetical protein
MIAERLRGDIKKIIEKTEERSPRSNRRKAAEKSRKDCE